MTQALYLLATLGALGAFDTVYFHEWRARLPARSPAVRPELLLHAARDFIYGMLFATLPAIAWQGAWLVALVAALAAEIVITLSDFVVEDRVRKPLGGVYPGERVTHALMGIVYGSMLACLAPVLWRWAGAPTGLAVHRAAIPWPMRALMLVMAAGVVASGLRDLAAALELPGSQWPWMRIGEPAGTTADIRNDRTIRR